jgi:putative FmdB family regulatory protein
MPHYEFFCNACKKPFSTILTIAEHDAGKTACPHSGSHEVEQSWSVFSAVTSKKSAWTRQHEEARIRFDKFSFGTLRIDGSAYEQDVVIDCGEIRKRKKTPSRKFRDEFGHTPLSIGEKIPWKCHRLVIGTGAYGRLPVMKEVKLEAERRHVELVIVPTSEAIRLIEKESAVNAILHVTC